ncbi:AraC family transcriptional regulator [Glycomyces tritici]|uniref:AraC family transcriptional regulator n=1 Tax=Glycomyces tritici TaxID=2665176 RepID=A0ABT7YUE3_9ACTN|nr:AraC family transcriptional regulator [Glycomyces tritici]MDN3241476.1 AraC family transcriptional regulator [Glycomyces tritici]MDN3242263.1 AraC family transcriptional regulator [Glycomyces tritici]
MDESLIAADEEGIPEGFAGQRMLVVPRAAVDRALRHPLTGKLLVTDAGHFPHAARHGRSRPQGAAEHVLLVCTGGSGWCRTGGTRFPVSRGGVVLLPADRPHAYGAAEQDPWTLWWLHFTGADAADLVRTAHEAAGGPVTHLRDPAPVASLVSQVIDALDTGPTLAALVRGSGAAWHALAHVVATGRRAPGPQPSPLERAVAHLRATAPQRTSVAALASMVGLSPSHLSARFREHLGVSPLQYQVQLRMARARELLDGTDLPVTAVARETGFDDPMYFSRQFHHHHAMTPTAYRDRPQGT